MDMILQFASLMVFMLGIVLGEFLAYRAFGRPKSGWVFLIDLALIVTIITVSYSFIQFYELGTMYFLVNFALGAMTIMATRAIEWLFKLTQRDTAGKNQIIALIRTLAHHGLDADEIKKALKEMRMPVKEIDRYRDLIGKSVPKYMPRLSRIESTLEKMESRLNSMEEKITSRRSTTSSASRPRT